VPTPDGRKLTTGPATCKVKLTRNDGDFDATVLFSSDAFCFLHEQCSKPLRMRLSNVTMRGRVHTPGAETLWGLFRALAQLCHTRGVPGRCWCYPPHHFSAQALGETCLLRSIFSAEGDRRGYPAQGPHTKGRSPSHHSRHSLCGATRLIPASLCGVSRVSAKRVRPTVVATGNRKKREGPYPNFTKPNVATFRAKIFHPIQRELAEVTGVF
jgi:hypothetical protein